MSKTYTDLPETQFPDAIDELSRMSDLTSGDIPLVNEYYAYYNAGNMTAAAQLLANNPSLLSKLFNAAKFNILRDALIALQRFYMSDVQTYIDSTRQSLEDEIMDRTTYDEYDPEHVYKKSEYVMYNGDLYVANKDGVVGQAPTGETDENWIRVSLRGEQGVSGTGLAFRGMYSLDTTYYKDDCASDGHRIWAALKECQGQPLEEGEYWTLAVSLDTDGLQRQHATKIMQLFASDWVDSRQTISVPGVTETNTIFVAPVATDQDAYTESEIFCASQAVDALTFTCVTIPETDMFVNIVILNDV